MNQKYHLGSKVSLRCLKHILFIYHNYINHELNSNWLFEFQFLAKEEKTNEVISQQPIPTATGTQEKLSTVIESMPRKVSEAGQRPVLRYQPTAVSLTGSPPPPSSKDIESSSHSPETLSNENDKFGKGKGIVKRNVDRINTNTFFNWRISLYNHNSYQFRNNFTTIYNFLFLIRKRHQFRSWHIGVSSIKFCRKKRWRKQ